MKNFATYLAESEKTFAYRIKIVGDVDSDFMKSFREKLKKYEPAKIGEVKKTPIQSQPAGFPNFPNQPVNIMDVEFRYPATPPQITQMAELCGLEPDRLCMADLHWSEGMDRELLGIEEQNQDLLNTPYPANTKEQNDLKKDYAAVGVDKQVVKNSADDAVWTVAGGKTPAAETTNDLPQGVKSPMTNIKRPPRPETGFRK
jgi:hypothetical protein